MAHPEKTKMLSSAYSYSSQKQPLMPILLLRSILRLHSSISQTQTAFYSFPIQNSVFKLYMCSFAAHIC